MARLYTFLQSLSRNRDGITAIEYAVLAGGVAIALAAVFSSTGIFTDLETKLKDIIGSIDTGAGT
jgi:Flp pilus assembly pilin Flp